MKKLTTNVSFTVSKNENKETSKTGFINSTVSNSLNKVSDFSKIGEISSKFSNLDINKIEDVLSSVKKPIIKKPIFSNTIVKDSIKESFKIPISKIKTPNLSKEEKIIDEEDETSQSEEEFDLDLPRSEVISLIDFKPLLNNNNTLSIAGNHFQYQLIYLNAIKLMINNDIKKYFSQSNKDLSNFDDLKTMLKLINDKSYSNIDFDLYTNQYFEKIINITDYSISQINDFYFKIDNINKKFIKNSDLINLIKRKDLEIIENFSSNKLYALAILLLDEKISIKSRKLLKRQIPFISSINRGELLSLNDKLYFDINLENKVGSLPSEYTNLVINDKRFDLKFSFDSDINQRISTILDYMIYESYKENNINSIYNFSEKKSTINSKQINFETEDFNKGTLLNLLTSYPQTNSDDKQRYLFADKESETYISKIFEEIISTNFNQNSIELLGNEINVEQNEQQTDKNKIISKLGNLGKKIKFDRSLINSLESGQNNQPPPVNSLLRRISKNLKNYNFIKYEKNLNSIISIIKELVKYYNDQVQFAVNAKEVTWAPINGHPGGTFKHVVGSRDNNSLKVKHLTDALRFIHFSYEGKNWKPESKVSNCYVPYGNSEEDILNFIGFLTYLFKRTGINPGQYSIDIPEQFKNNPKVWEKATNVSYIGNYPNGTSINKSYWLAFNELIKTINDPSNEFSSNKNPFYQKFSQTYIDILKVLNINDLSYASYNFESIIDKNNEQLFIMFNCFIFLTDLIKEFFKFEATTHWFIYETQFNDEDDYFSNYISKSKNTIGIAGEMNGANDVIFYPDLNDNLPKNLSYGRARPLLDKSLAIFTSNGYAPCQRFNALDIDFFYKEPIKEFNTIFSNWTEEFNKTKDLYSYFNNNLNDINSLINDLLSLDYDLLRFMIDPKFSLNKRSFFMTKFQFNDLKEKYNKIKNNEINYLIDNEYNQNYYSIIQKSFSGHLYKDLGKNAKIMTFGVPNDIKDSNEIIVTIYRKNLIHDDLIFKPIQKSFNLNLFCTLTNLYGKVDISDLIKGSDYYYFNNDLSFNKIPESQLSTFNNEILNNHFYSEILNEYIKIMCGLEINDFTLIKDFPIIDSEQVLTNLSGIINLDDESKKRLLTLRNKVTKFVNPLEFRSHLFSNCIFERVFSLLIDPDDFEIDISNWNKKGWSVNNLTSLPFNIIKVNPTESMFSSQIPFAQTLAEEYKLYLQNSDNIVDSYKIKIDKK